MVDFAEHTARIYARLGDLINGPEGEFQGFISTPEKDVFGVARTSTHLLRYQSSIALGAGDALVVPVGEYAGTYAVHGLPRRINGSEFEAELVKQ